MLVNISPESMSILQNDRGSHVVHMQGALVKLNN
jgi:hypothetical protein